MAHTTDYLIEMKLAPTGSILTPAEAVAFAERVILPTLDECQRLAASGKIVAGGPAIGAMAFHFVLRAASAQEVDEIVGALPAWPRAQTTVTALGLFERRAGSARERIARVKATIPIAGAVERN